MGGPAAEQSECEMERRRPAEPSFRCRTCGFLQCRKDIAKVTIYYKQLNYQSLNESPLLSVRLL